MDIKTLLNYAVRAPSTHNSQPWLFKIKENSCEIYPDPGYNLPEADPVNRDMYISIGCCLENMILAAKYFGVYKDISIYRDLNISKPAAEVFLKQSIADKPASGYENLCEAIKQRFNARGVFEERPADEKVIHGFNRVFSEEYDHKNIKIDFVLEKDKIRNLADLTRKGIRAAYQSKNFREEMSGWINNALSKKNKGIPSRALRMPFLVSFVFPKLVRFFDLGKKLGEINYKSICSAPALAVLSARDDEKTGWINTGRTGQRLMLECFARGLKTSIFAAAVEMGFAEEVQKITGSDFKPQLLIAMGYMNTPQRPTPREPVEKKIFI